jgi:hypothetical protein
MSYRVLYGHFSGSLFGGHLRTNAIFVLGGLSDIEYENNIKLPTT